MNNNREPIRINPSVQELDAKTINSHIEGLISESETQKSGTTPHELILDKLLQQVEPLDFKTIVFPEALKLSKQLAEMNPKSDDAKDVQQKLEKFKINQRHQLITSVENICKLAEKNSWGLCKNHDFVYLYNGKFWSAIDKETFQKFLGEASEKMGVDIYSARYYEFRDKLFKQFLALGYLPTPITPNASVLINLRNGTFEISSGKTKLRPFSRKDFLTYQLPFDYDPNAKAPLFQKYLNEVLPDKSRQQILAEYLGYVFIRHGSKTLKEEKALILYGTGANGKSVFFDVVNALLGNENISSYSLQSLTNDNGYYRAKLSNKLVNYASEINGKLEASIFKQMVSGEPVEARLPYGQPFVMTQYAKLIFNCNILPKDVEHTEAYFRRFLIIPFDVKIPEDKQDKRLSFRIIESELSGVFNWVLDGLYRLLRENKFSDCEAATYAIEQYKTESNSVKLFLDENNYKKSTDQYKLLKELYPEYKLFCIDDGITAFKKTNFRKQIEALGFVVERQGGTGQNIVFLHTDSDGLP